jgi:hypothetical protein
VEDISAIAVAYTRSFRFSNRSCMIRVRYDHSMSAQRVTGLYSPPATSQQSLIMNFLASFSRYTAHHLLFSAFQWHNTTATLHGLGVQYDRFDFPPACGFQYYLGPKVHSFFHSPTEDASVALSAPRPFRQPFPWLQQLVSLSLRTCTSLIR